MIDTEKLQQEIVAACDEDHVGLWEIVRMIERRDATLDVSQVRAIALNVLRQMLAAGQIEAGAPANDGRDFDVWGAPAVAIVEKLTKDWQPETRPSIGELAWFTTPPKTPAL